jgi:hypothetical protein
MPTTLTSYAHNSKNGNILQEPLKQKKQENPDTLPLVRVKDIYKPFDYKGYKNNNSSSSTANSDDVDKQQLQELFFKSPKIASHQALNAVELHEVRKQILRGIVGDLAIAKRR